MTWSTKEWIAFERPDSRKCEEWPWTLAHCCNASSSEGLAMRADTVAQSGEAPEGLIVEAWRNALLRGGGAMIPNSPIQRAVLGGTIPPESRLTTEELAGEKPRISRRSRRLRLLDWGEHRLSHCEKIRMSAP
jgi:hypothetical protein